eukprot:Plantae.Rhodophyta-Hildenbrandia_rubra.ctg17678.p1 GENE.Plantae.Rhodophyta-Hildenbrandia_rubra.ctg17678~~Plantae.Rhodophyta-Hildenbrandia_rubra.ctg17678.p1  ORF type:complete len:494 (+),score=98.73 Plantae.Rhodophyta-Hildenbrandia_rubra.ctg17678:25-1482(+)
MAPTGATPGGGGKREESQNEVLDGVALDEILSARLGIRKIRIEGAERTSESFIKYLFSPALRSDSSINNDDDGGGRRFREVLEDVAEGVGRLESSGVMSGVDAMIDRSEFSGGGEYEFGDLVVTVKEKSRYAVRTGTSMSPHGDLTTSIDGMLCWRNILGNAEICTASASWLNPGSFQGHPSNKLEVVLVKPFLFSLSSALFVNGAYQTLNHAPHSEYSLKSTLGSLMVSTGLGEFSYRCVLREPHDVSKGVSPIIRDECNPSLLSGLVYNATIDTRDNPRVPTVGRFVTLDTKVGGLFKLGDVRLAKAEIACQQHVALGIERRISLSFAMRMGAVTTFGDEKDKDVRIIDKHFLGGNGIGGGSSPMRGFQTRGVGPMDAGGSLGGSAFYVGTAMLTLAAPVGSLLERAFNGRVHLFGTMGDCGNGWMNRNWRSFKDTMRTAVGVGVALETGLGRIEVNFCRPLRKSKGDKAQDGVQFALTREFL